MNALYLKVAAALERHGVPTPIKADIDSIFADDSAPAAPAGDPVPPGGGVPAPGAATPGADLSADRRATIHDGGAP